MQPNYNQWTSSPRLNIVYSLRDSITVDGITYPKAYVCNANNASMLKSAKSWAGGNNQITPRIVETDNKDFNMTVLQGAKGSSQGGKLSFWMCSLEKPGIPAFVTAINADILLTLIRQTVLDHGVVKTPVLLARKKGELGALHTQMTEYQEVLADLQTKADLKVGKTTKWEPGCSYATLTQEHVMLGYFPRIMVPEQTTVNSWKLNFQNPEKVAVCVEADENTSLERIATNLFQSYSGERIIVPKPPARQLRQKLFDIGPDFYQLMERYAKAHWRESRQWYIQHNNCYAIDFDKELEKALLFFEYNPQFAVDVAQTAVQYTNNDKNPSKGFTIEYNGQTIKLYSRTSFYEKLLEIVTKEAALRQSKTP